MTTRTINRELIVHNDLAIGNGTVVQTRGDRTATEQLLELEFIFRTVDEIRYLNITKYTHVALHSNGPLAPYHFDNDSTAIDNGDSILAPIPSVPSGRWIKSSQINSGIVLDYNTVVELIADSAIVPSLSLFDRAVVLGYHMPGDKGGGTFYWDPLSTEDHDAGITLLPTGHTGVGRWKRVIRNLVSVHHFGAVGDGVTNDREAFDYAFTTTSRESLVLGLEDRSYNLAGMVIILNDDLRVSGVGTPLLHNGNTMTLRGTLAYINNMNFVNWVRGIVLDPQGSAAYNFDQVGCVNTTAVYPAIEAVPTAIIRTLRVDGGYFSGSLQAAYYLPCSVTTVNINDVKIDAIDDEDSGDAWGIKLGTAETPCNEVLITNCDIDGITCISGDCRAIEVIGDNVVISNNIIKNLNGSTSIAIYATVSDAIITDNTLTDCGRPSGTGNGGPGYGLAGWITCNLSTVSVGVNNIIISDNVLKANPGKPGEGIFLVGTGTVTNNRMSGDSIETGITVKGNGTIDKFIVTGNHINCPAAEVGINAIGVTESIIMSNHIVTTNYAIQSEVLTTYGFYNCDISHNYLEANWGITLANSMNVRMDGNTFETAIGSIQGTYTSGWWFIDGVMRVDIALLGDINSVVNNMEYKRAGFMVWDNTGNKPVYADGALQSSLWLNADGTVASTPV